MATKIKIEWLPMLIVDTCQLLMAKFHEDVDDDTKNLVLLVPPLAVELLVVFCNLLVNEYKLDQVLIDSISKPNKTMAKRRRVEVIISGSISIPMIRIHNNIGLKLQAKFLNSLSRLKKKGNTRVCIL